MNAIIQAIMVGVMLFNMITVNVETVYTVGTDNYTVWYSGSNKLVEQAIVERFGSDLWEIMENTESKIMDEYDEKYRVTEYGIIMDVNSEPFRIILRYGEEYFKVTDI